MQRHPTVGSERLGRGKRGLGVVGRRQVRGTAGVVREEAEKRERERGGRLSEQATQGLTP